MAWRQVVNAFDESPLGAGSLQVVAVGPFRGGGEVVSVAVSLQATLTTWAHYAVGFTGMGIASEDALASSVPLLARSNSRVVAGLPTVVRSARVVKDVWDVWPCAVPVREGSLWALVGYTWQTAGRVYLSVSVCVKGAE